MSSSFQPMMTNPCGTCPFRKDVHFGLEPSRCEEIADQLIRGETFACHNTVIYGDAHNTKEDLAHRKQCAGATYFLTVLNKPNTYMQIAERLGLWDGELKSPVELCESLEEFIKNQEPK